MGDWGRHAPTAGELGFRTLLSVSVGCTCIYVLVEAQPSTPTRSTNGSITAEMRCTRIWRARILTSLWRDRANARRIPADRCTARLRTAACCMKHKSTAFPRGSRTIRRPHLSGSHEQRTTRDLIRRGPRWERAWRSAAVDPVVSRTHSFRCETSRRRSLAVATRAAQRPLLRHAGARGRAPRSRLHHHASTPC